MSRMNELKESAKSEYYLIKGLEVTVLTLSIVLLIFLITNILGVESYIKITLIEGYFHIYGIFFAMIGIIGGTIFWRWYRIPPHLHTALLSHYNAFGYSTKKTLFHTLKVEKSSDLFFKVKIHLYKRASDESCLFYLESMHLPAAVQNIDRFKKIGDRFFLKSDTSRQKYSTSCELDEVHLRSLLMTQAMEDFLLAKN